jgi:hypothetical protein
MPQIIIKEKGWKVRIATNNEMEEQYGMDVGGNQK